MYWTDDPVRDAARYDAEQDRKLAECCIGKCTQCGAVLYSFDDYYDVDGTLICDDCLYDWAAQYKK